MEKQREGEGEREREREEEKQTDRLTDRQRKKDSNRCCEGMYLRG